MGCIETFCLKCGVKQPYRTKSKFADDFVRGVHFGWVEDIAFCAVCGAEVYVAEVNDRNVAAREQAYECEKYAER